VFAKGALLNVADLDGLMVAEDPRLANGAIAYVVNRIELEEDRYHRSIWVYRHGMAKPFTNGPADTTPRWSPDGTRLAFLRAIDGAKSQVAVMPATGGEPSVVTDFALGVEDLVWSPDGGWLAVVAVDWLEPDLSEEERRRRPRRITSIPYRFDGKGTLDDRRRSLWLVDPSGLRPVRRLTDGLFDEAEPCWSPDGRLIAFLSDRHPRQGLELGIDAWEVEVASGKLLQAVPERGMWRLPTYRQDGLLHLLGRPEAVWPTTGHVYRRESDGTLTDLTAHLDRSPISLSAGPARVVWSGDRLITGLEDAGRFGLIGVDPDGSVERLLDGDMLVTGFDREGDRLVYTASTVTRPAELFDGGDMVTSLSGSLETVATDHFRAGPHEIDTFVTLPPGSDPVPVLLNIHGGPASQYGFGFFDEFQVYAAAGYAVVACNPRGSSGRGEAFSLAVTGEGWGVVDLSDILTALEAALDRHPRLDRERIGVMGGSYGGFMTAWLIGRDHRFKSAVVERGLLSWTSFAGTSDIGPNFPGSYLDPGNQPDWELLWSQSPLATAHQVRTPTLIIHSEEDWRCPIEQAEQYFAVLLRTGVAVEFLRFPGEGHELTRSGKPRHRQERFAAILDWHHRWLGEGSASG
jgi:dipeptidyl aminopeptidase/acylaminoacyl peptidase